MKAQIQIPGVSVSHCADHVYVSLHVRVAHPSSGVIPIVIQLMSQTMVARLDS